MGEESAVVTEIKRLRVRVASLEEKLGQTAEGPEIKSLVAKIEALEKKIGALEDPDFGEWPGDDEVS